MTTQFQMEKPLGDKSPAGKISEKKTLTSLTMDNPIIDNGSKMVAQTKRNQNLFGSVVQCDEWDDDEMGQAKFEDQGGSVESEIAASSGNTGMPSGLQAKMESTFNTDFSGVNVHSNSSKATDIGALAYTQGTDVHFAPGQYNPNTSTGQQLLGHELTHVVQQAEGRVQPTGSINGMALNDNTSLEKEADDMGSKFV